MPNNRRGYGRIVSNRHLVHGTRNIKPGDDITDEFDDDQIVRMQAQGQVSFLDRMLEIVTDSMGPVIDNALTEAEKAAKEAADKLLEGLGTAVEGFIEGSHKVLTSDDPIEDELDKPEPEEPVITVKKKTAAEGTVAGILAKRAAAAGE